MEKKEINESVIMKALEWAYDKAVNGIPGMSTAEELALEFLSTQTEGVDENDRVYNAANSLIRWQNTKAATTGFLTGLGGVMTLPVAIPANLGCVFYIQLRMIAAIAYMGGYNVKDDRVQTLAYVCLTGSSAADIIKQVGVKVGNNLAKNMLKNMSRSVITEINKKVGFRLLTKFGEKGVINLGKAIPVVGGVISGTLDAVATNVIGNTARDTFLNH